MEISGKARKMGSSSPNLAVQLKAANEPYFDLGSFSLKVSTTSADAQAWFDRALVWTFCFNHDEAITCYKQAIGHDDNLAIAYWGLSFCSGPNYNRTWRLFNEGDKRRAVDQCFVFSQQAILRAEAATPWERALIEALGRRYPDDNPDRDLAACDRAYADAMREVYGRFGAGDFTIITFFADALMNVAPRRLFDTATGQPIPTSPVFEVKALLEAALKMPGVERHPGVAHMYIHLMEMSATPEAALPAADMIRDLIPDTGHTYHMPAHIDVLVGDYRRAVEYNLKATLADDLFFQDSARQPSFYSYYRLHNFHSLIYAAMLGGKSKAALHATDRMEAAVTERLLRTEALADWMEFFKAVRVHVYIRFGMWEDLKQLQPLEDKHLYCVTNVMRHYGKAIAHAATGEIAEAEAEKELFHQASLLVPPERLDFPNKIRDILKVASAMLDGETEYRRGNFAKSFERLSDAVALEDDLPFAEPWGWMLPARHAYAALSLEQGLVEQAAVAYAEDLGLLTTPKRAHQHPNNVWALHGYHECLVRLGRTAEANIIQQQLKLALAEADVEITSSCFCRLGVLKSTVNGEGCRTKCCL
ncbi:tetratricopeptide repeat domain protein [Plectosphaerella plurivora]|uniref:Tetratricopeptide repeat domain protein n=1 Tax=Plectosphaerella plurivora TaxID=936078 RepID=A0A9P8VN55_9PEZI|nr:tetratricopeptide repeat domain protein [Plectosphaerella plurivora]